MQLEVIVHLVKLRCLFLKVLCESLFALRKMMTMFSGAVGTVHLVWWLPTLAIACISGVVAWHLVVSCIGWLGTASPVR